MLNPITVTGRTSVETWLACIERVLEAGSHQHDGTERIHEISPLLVHVEGLGLDGDDDIPEGMRAQTREEASQFCSAKPLADKGWSYGQRLRGEGVDQIEDVVHRLNRKPESKAATAVTLRPGREGLQIPCLVALDWKIRAGALQVAAFFRSQDIFGKQLANLLAIGQLSKEVGARLGLQLGGLSALVASAHVYDRDADRARQTVQQLRPRASGVIEARLQVLIIGKEKGLSTDHPVHRLALQCAKEVGRLLARHRACAINGGLGGIMEAACAGVHDGDGVSIGIIPDIPAAETPLRYVNRWQTAVIKTGMPDRQRIPLLVQSADAIICISGGGGTRIEAQSGMERRIPVAVVDGTGGAADELASEFLRSPRDMCFVAKDAGEAVEWVLRTARPTLREGIQK